MERRWALLMGAFTMLCPMSIAQDATVYAGEDPLQTDVYIFRSDSTFRHCSKSLGQFSVGAGEWYDVAKVRTLSFGVRDTATVTMDDPVWSYIDTTGIFLQRPVQQRGPSLHFFKVKSARLMYYDHRYSFWERLRREKAGFLLRQP